LSWQTQPVRRIELHLLEHPADRVIDPLLRSITASVQQLRRREVRFFDDEKSARLEERTELLQHGLTLSVVDQDVPAVCQIELSVERDLAEIAFDDSVGRRRQVLKVGRLDIDGDNFALPTGDFAHPLRDRTGSGPEFQTTPPLPDTGLLQPSNRRF